jgi:uncharacterized protein
MNYTKLSLEKLRIKAQSDYKTNKKVLSRLSKMKPQKLDEIMLSLHNQEFDKINCLDCANCCKTISPAMNDTDIRRMASALKIKETDLLEQYLFLDSEGDYVFKKSPCPFLQDDNKCQIYSARPKACREYPHTDRKRFYQILDLTAENTKVCPAVFNIIEHVKKISADK